MINWKFRVINNGENVLKIIPNSNVLFLIKFGRKEHLEKIKDGCLRLKQLHYYRAFEEKEISSSINIRDENEGVQNYIDTSRMEEINQEKSDRSFISSARINYIKNFPDNISNKYIFCLSFFRIGDIGNKVLFDERILDCHDWEYVLVIPDSLNFIINVLKAFSQCNPRFGLVEYRDLNKSTFGADEYIKSNEFAYQRECRFSIDYYGQNNPAITQFAEDTIEIAFENVPGIIVSTRDFLKDFKSELDG